MVDSTVAWRPVTAPGAGLLGPRIGGGPLTEAVSAKTTSEVEAW